MKIVDVKANHSDFEVAHFLKVARPFVIKVHKQLEATGGDSTAVVKRKTPAKCPNIIKTTKFVRNCRIFFCKMLITKELRISKHFIICRM